MEKGGGAMGGKSLHSVNGQADGSADEGCAERGGGNGAGEGAAFFGRWQVCAVTMLIIA